MGEWVGRSEGGWKDKGNRLRVDELEVKGFRS